MLVLKSITAGYGGTTVLRDVTLVVPPSSVVALLGANGAGKTTLLRVASGLLVPDRGRVVFDGNDVTGVSADRLAARGLCHVPEGRGIFPPLSVQENLLLFSPPGEQNRALERAIEAFPALKGRLKQTAGTMSGGEQQMLALARSYVSNSRLILLDEVSMGLAPIVVDAIFTFLRRLANEGISLLLVEQYTQKALAIADYFYILSKGCIRLAGDPGELVDKDIFAQYVGAHV